MAVSHRVTIHSLAHTHHRVLVEVVVGPPSNGVEGHDVFKVTDLLPHPLLSDARGCQQTFWWCQSSTVQVGGPLGENGSANLLYSLYRKGEDKKLALRGVQGWTFPNTYMLWVQYLPHAVHLPHPQHLNAHITHSHITHDGSYFNPHQEFSM